MNASSPVSVQPLSNWTMAARREPAIRVGIVLPEDHMLSLRLEIPAEGFALEGDGKRVPVSGGIEARLDGDRVVLEPGGLDAAAVVRLRPPAGQPLDRGIGVRCMGVVAGRGFHWQTRIDPTFAGTLEFRALEGRLLVVNELPMEDYLAGVIAAEMSGECPLEFLRSQCIVARSWALAHTEDKHSEMGVDRCNDDCCQRYQGTMDITPVVAEAVMTTRGQAITDQSGRIIDANYSKSCGGIIESPEHVWGARKPGLRAEVDAPASSKARRFFPLRDSQVEEFLTGPWADETDVFCSPSVVPNADLPRYLGKVDDGGGHFRWKVRYARAELEAVLTRKFFSRQAADPLGTLTDLRVIARGDSGRARQLRIDYLDRAGRPRSEDIHTEYNIRDALHASFLYSSAFVIKIERDAAGVPATIELLGAGWGHGAGLCQIGALGMSLQGYLAEQILHHYYSPIRIHTCY